ncbi:MAG TPA: HTTM domain-containing protein, partial [Thermoanaerobaculia bacterium]|nr:HTTM domain-containing protein [Thermoanaerobaculia bacterium]
MSRPSSTLLAGWWRDAVGIDARSLGLFRIGIAAVVLCDLGSRALDLRAHYSDWGLLPRWAAAIWLGRGAWLSPFMWNGSAWWAALLMAVTAAAALALLVGWRSRTMAAICFVLMAGLHARNPGVVYGGDNLLRVLLFWMPWLPLPGAWAVGGRGCGAGDVLSAPGVAAIRLQLCLVYWLTAFVKLNSAWLGERDAVLTALYYDQFVTSWGKVLRRFPALMRAMAPATVGFELLGPLLVWLPGAGRAVRTAIVLAFVGFHLLGMGTTLHLGIFPWICAVAWSLFLPTWFWQRVRPAARAAQEVHDGATAAFAAPSTAVPRSRARRFANTVVAALVAYMVLLAAAEVLRTRIRLPPAVTLPATILAIHQQWHMFMRPPRDDG